MALNVASGEVKSWTPGIQVAAGATVGNILDAFRQQISLGYNSPEISFRRLGESFVLGWCAAIKSENFGEIEDTLYGVYPPIFDELIPKNANTSRISDVSPLIIGNGWYKNYYHWTFQAIGCLLIYKRYRDDSNILLAMPRLNGWRNEVLSLTGFNGRLLEMDYHDVLHIDDCITSNLTGGGFAHLPHPAVIAEFEALAQHVTIERRFSRKLYVSRLDAGDVRRVVNEKAVCALLESRGFEIITPSELSVKEQVVAFRDAEVIVAPHGAGLANLVYCQPGVKTRVIELFQASCINACYARVCQAKGLDYTAIINPDRPGQDADGTLKEIKTRNDMWQIVDLALLERVLAA
ncbi:DUF563 domain-containing protein [Agrobacterium vitis]|uniref:glycosyltransferase family 61 protein n=1 Tax=Rhizobium/Agrobacterium group TaxID=227290 RepID=UPI0008DC1811|nr:MULTISPECIES: glycosyltransferase family 61 protein [Rhizobium/Agrobacterium group]MCF1435761.1 glycosyltransferase family 61 protein [Allorhizobium ampelinum]MUO90359.1 DUF563 domain-containing protein [Agrobacterium vitis]MUZ52371.1 DUF563 domain-containing protein [Agrobacterium vitis]MUZ91580.1 DUF563 domain-containing protein [Agrobacterium vitis]OHZ43767.1 hypothetical protein BBL07_01040 [Agrobacterium vitis]